MNNNEFVYATYIKTTPEKLWAAITNPEFTRQYWGAHVNISDWKKGSKWKHENTADGAIRVEGEIIESTPPTHLVLSWATPQDVNDVSRVSFTIETMGELVRLEIVHGSFKAGSDMPGKISKGWPLVLSSLKSFLETGKPIDILSVKTPCGSEKAA